MPYALNRTLVLPLLLAALALPGAASAKQTQPQSQSGPAPAGTHNAAATERVRCLAKAESAPDFAYGDAVAWEKRGGGADARLCQALALLARGDNHEAAERLEKLIPELTESGPVAIAGLWNRAGWGWQKAGETDRALNAFGEAIRLRPDEPDLLIDRGLVLAAAERYWDALADLERVVKLQPGRAEAYVYRAQSLVKLSRAAQAESELSKALGIEPGHAEALLMRGNLRLLRGDEKGARTDWEKVAQAAPDSSQGRVAAAHLAKLDDLLKAEDPAKKP